MMKNTSAISDLDYGKLVARRDISDLSREVQFTEVFKKHLDVHSYVRESECLKVQTRMIMAPMQPGDWFAGRLDRMFVGIDPERGDVIEAAFFCRFDLLQEQYDDPQTTPNIKEQIKYLLDFWKEHATYFKCRNAFSQRVKEGLPSVEYYKNLQISFPMFGLGGPCLDYEKLIKLGIPGLRGLVKNRKERAVLEGEKDLTFYLSLETALDIFCEMAIRYADETSRMVSIVKDGSVKKKLQRIHDSLRYIVENAPSSYHQAIQLMWLYNLIALPRNYGRMDIYLGDLLAKDLDSGILTHDEALDITVGLWRHIVDRTDNFNNRIIIGGKGRPNELNADRFALLALEAQRVVNDAIPQLSVRWYKGMNPAILDKSLEVLASGSTMPIIYNDDANIPGVMKAMNVPYEEAEQYAFYGCGEFLLDHRSVASPDAAVNILKCLDVTLRNGTDSFTGQKQGLELGSLKDYKTFDELFNVFAKQVENQMEIVAEATDVIYRETAKEAAFPFLSLLYDDCIERGKPLLAGGVRYLGGTVETFGNNTTADALYAIKKLVYDEKIMTAVHLMECLDKNFDGCSKEWKLIRSFMKFGNDNIDADAMAVRVNEMIGAVARKQKDRTSLDSFLMVMINNGDSVLFGKTTGASADGRRRGEPVSNGNQPSVGNDMNGITALLNSMSRLNPASHAGVTHNVKFGRRMLQKNRQQIRSLINAYFEQGGTQMMITTTDKNELERAMLEPEKYSHVFVRVGGYSERFVNLPKEVQMEVIKRTLYE